MNKRRLTTENTEITEKKGVFTLCSLRSLWFMLLLFAGCVPGETPSVLNQTPGAPIIVDGERYANAIFSVNIPTGWRVITAAADSAPAVTFAAPDNCTVIHLSSVPAEPPVAPACDQPTQTITREITLANLTVYAAGSAPISAWDAFTGILEDNIESLQTQPHPPTPSPKKARGRQQNKRDEIREYLR